MNKLNKTQQRIMNTLNHSKLHIFDGTRNLQQLAKLEAMGMVEFVKDTFDGKMFALKGSLVALTEENISIGATVVNQSNNGRICWIKQDRNGWIVSNNRGAAMLFDFRNWFIIQ